MRRKVQQEHENHERWLVSYADFITLLFAFFVVMFASTQSDKNKAKVVSDSVRDALQHGQFTTAFATVLGRGRHEATRQPLPTERVKDSENIPPPGMPNQPPADLSRSRDTLNLGLVKELEAGKIGLKLEGRGLIISLRESGFFASGDDTVSSSGSAILAKIADVIQGIPNPLRLEGHTDAIPIHTSRFRSNWELSAARSIATMELLRTKFRVPASRMSVAGYAENAPADTNDTEEGRAHNRRVDLVVLSAEGTKSEPHGVK
jgi:chemotaxis protein MotB